MQAILPSVLSVIAYLSNQFPSLLGPSDNALVVESNPSPSSSRRASYGGGGGGGGSATLSSMSVYLNRHNGLDRTCR